MNLKEIRNVIQTEMHCVDRDCDRDCGNCDLVMDKEVILEAYAIAKAILYNLEVLKCEYKAYNTGSDYWRGIEYALNTLNIDHILL